jgi:hypothetical protein
MDVSARDRLRRDIRRAVHQACLHRFERDRVVAPLETELDLESLCAAHAEAAVAEEEIRHWVAEDEEEFEHALLISDLVARRVGRTNPQTGPTPALAAEEPGPKTAAANARPARQAPSIATLLDDMFAQPPARTSR